jgi:hypothetical protein
MYSTRAGMQSLKRGAAVRALHMDRRLTRAFTRSLATIPIPMVHNSLNAISEELTKERPGSWHWYSCGPTVYDDAHLGHARYVLECSMNLCTCVRMYIHISWPLTCFAHAQHVRLYRYHSQSAGRRVSSTHNTCAGHH